MLVGAGIRTINADLVPDPDDRFAPSRRLLATNQGEAFVARLLRRHEALQLLIEVLHHDDFEVQRQVRCELSGATSFTVSVTQANLRRA